MLLVVLVSLLLTIVVLILEQGSLLQMDQIFHVQAQKLANIEWKKLEGSGHLISAT